MNPAVVVVGATAVISGGIGFLIGVGVTQDKERKRYEEANASYRRAVELAQDIKGEKPAATEAELITDAELHSISIDMEPGLFNGKLEVVPRPAENPYHKAISATETPMELFVDGGINDYGISYIEEEEYEEEDGRFKGQITVVIDDFEPQFFMGGIMINDWAERIGDSIVVDFQNRVPAGLDPILYVRNHKTEEDYEVVLESP